MQDEAIVVEWRQKYDKLAEELHSLRVSRREAESKCELVENESFRREAAQKAEVSCLQKQLSDAESKIASLEAEVDSISREKVVLQSAEKENSPLRVACESPGLLPLNVVSSRPSSPKTMSEPIKSPQKREYTGLVRRHNAARLITEELTNRNIGLTRELAVCKQALAASQAKLSLVTEQLEEEKASHTNDVQALHDRVADLLGDRDCEARRCDSLLTEVNQLKEYNERIKREHVCQLRTFDKILQDRERAIYELISMTNGGGDEPRGSVKAHWEGDGCVTKAPQMLHPIDETMPLGEATQISHDESSSVFNTSVENPANIQVVTQAGEVARLQNEVVNLRSRLMAQVKTNMRLKTAYKALASSSVKAPVNLSQSLNRTSNDAGVANASRVDLGSFTFGGGGLNDTNCGLAERSMTRGEPGEVLEKTVHELHTTLERLECEISALEAPSVTRPCNLPNTVATSAPSQSMNEAVGVVEGGGDEKAKEMCVCSVAVSRRGSVQSLERLKELHSVIKSLLTQFDSIRTIQRSFRETANRSLMVSISSEVECGTQQTWSFACDGRNPTHNGSFGGGDVGCEGSGGVGERCTKWPAERDCDRSKDGDDVVTETDCVACQSVVVSQHAESLLLSTCNDTTMGNLRLDVGGDTEASRGDVDDSLDVSSVRTGCQSLVGGRLNVSRVEDHNRRVFDRVSVAVARIQDAVDKWSVKVAAEVLMALNGPDKFDYVVDDGDRRDYSQRREMHVSFSKVRDEHSEWADETEAGEVEEALEEEVKTISLREHEAIVAEYESRCSQLTSANDELQKTYVQLSEELESAYRKHAESIATLQATMVSKSDYDELVGEVTQAQNVARELENRANELQVSGWVIVWRKVIVSRRCLG
uniref:ANK_REP_REGION domain-containing protein n=1 Tax=Mesocestoides corti TaxID=53468 RepID=A0A5K3FHR5_MESCO